MTVLAWVGVHSGLAAAGARTSLLAEPGTIAFLVVFGMAVILYFVFKSMSKHLRKVNQAAREEAEAAEREEALDSSADDADSRMS